MTATVASLLSVALVSLVSLVGLATLSLSEARARRLATVFISFAVGALLGDAFIHLMPETFGPHARGTPLTQSLLVLAGMLAFFVVEKLLRHHHGVLHAHHHGDPEPHAALASLNVAGDAVHNFMDGVMIGASYLVSPALGVTTTVAVLLHELPQELGDFAILLHSGLSARRAVLLNLASASVAFLGTAVALVAGAVAQQAVGPLIPLTAGGFVYLAAADLIPELQHDRGWRALLVQTALICAGIAVMGLLTLLD